MVLNHWDNQPVTWTSNTFYKRLNWSRMDKNSLLSHREHGCRELHKTTTRYPISTPLFHYNELPNYPQQLQLKHQFSCCPNVSGLTVHRSVLGKNWPDLIWPTQLKMSHFISMTWSVVVSFSSLMSNNISLDQGWSNKCQHEWAHLCSQPLHCQT